MAKVYGRSDSEISFLHLLNSNMKQNDFNSLEDYQDFKRNPRESKKQLEESYDEKIKEAYDKISYLTNEQKQLVYDLNGVRMSLQRKQVSLKKLYGPLKEKVWEEVEALRRKERRLNSELENSKEERVKKSTEKDDLIMDKKKAIYNFDLDVKKLDELDYNIEFINKRQGAFGENNLINYIKGHFEKHNDFCLLNGVTFDISGSAININHSNKSSNQIDHILICPKGVFFIETKFWKKDCTEDFYKKLLEQLEKIKMTIQYKFENKINKEFIHILLVGTEKKIKLNESKDYTSLKLEELGPFIEKESDIITKDEMILILNEFPKHLSSEEFKSFPKGMIKIKSLFIKTKRYIKGKFSK